MQGVAKQQFADFVHGADGLGNTSPQAAKGKAINLSAPDFLKQSVNENPGKITIVALGPLTNLAKVKV